MSEHGSKREQAHKAIQAAKAALARGDRDAAYRLSRAAVEWAPDWAASWLMLAAVSDPAQGLKYVARALQLEPQSKAARQAIPWMIRRIPPRNRRQAVQDARLPSGLGLKLAPKEAALPYQFD